MYKPDINIWIVLYMSMWMSLLLTENSWLQQTDPAVGKVKMMLLCFPLLLLQPNWNMAVGHQSKPILLQSDKIIPDITDQASLSSLRSEYNFEVKEIFHTITSTIFWWDKPPKQQVRRPIVISGEKAINFKPGLWMNTHSKTNII